MPFNFLKQIVKGTRNNRPVEKDYQSEIFDIIQQHAGGKNSISSIVDVGAHHGSYSLKARKSFPGARIFSVEPYRKSFEILNANMSDGNSRNFNVALSDTEGQQYLHVNSFDETNSLYESSETGSQIDGLIKNISKEQVQVKTLDAICEENNLRKVDLLKIDVQGNELNVLKGAQRLMENHNISFIQCEVEFIEIYKSQPLFHEVATFLYGKDFGLYSLYNFHFDINKRFSWADALFIQNKFLKKVPHV